MSRERRPDFLKTGLGHTLGTITRPLDIERGQFGFVPSDDIRQFAQDWPGFNGLSTQAKQTNLVRLFNSLGRSARWINYSESLVGTGLIRIEEGLKRGQPTLDRAFPERVLFHRGYDEKGAYEVWNAVSLYLLFANKRSSRIEGIGRGLASFMSDFVQSTVSVNAGLKANKDFVEAMSFRRRLQDQIPPQCRGCSTAWLRAYRGNLDNGCKGRQIDITQQAGKLTLVGYCSYPSG